MTSTGPLSDRTVTVPCCKPVGTEADALTSSITTAEQENGRLQDAIDKLDTPEGVENVARDKLDMAAEGEIIFYDVSD